ncbi:MAG: bifunctional [glutamate--ammonia ligase]-adenylyl-L-tyrosine phosphorylase/[glutamate--ammonia-ligase] adenylyltransferase, partial [Methylococcus sp.]
MSLPTPDLNTLPETLQPAVRNAWESFQERSGGTTLPAEIQTSIPRVWAASPFIAGHCARRPELLHDLIGSGRLARANAETEYADLLAGALTGIDNESGLMAMLRRFRKREMVRIAWRDIAGWAPLPETLLDVSRLADACTQAALEFLFRQACESRGTPVNSRGEPQNLVVLGMGKLGAWELNFSSDIDLIFAYRDDGELDDRKQTAYAEFYTKLARKLVTALDAMTEDGFVFRVDTRLRPFGDSGPLVMSFDAMEAYYQSQAREWERYAMVKVRTMAGDLAAGRELEDFLRPFVYRRYLDYRALGELRELKRKITLELVRKERQENVKLGPGGIREIEFIGQAFQLIRGGQERGLQERRIQVVLNRLRELELMPAESVRTLLDAYAYLRTVENRLQQYADRQTHDLPASPEERLAIAFALGHADWDGFKAELDAVRQRVHAIFLEVIAGGQSEEDAPTSLLGDDEQVAATLSRLGFSDTGAALQRLGTFRLAAPIRKLTPRGETELNRVLPELIRATARTEAPVLALERVLEVIEAIASRNVYLTLLAENPPAREQLVKLAAASPWISHAIARHPLLLDELLDPRSLYHPLTREELRCELARKLDGIDVDDPEPLMIALRQFKQANVLRVAAADISGAIPLMVVSDYLSYTAETLVDSVMRGAWRMTARRHGVPPGARPDEPDGFCVIAYGKLGGLELGYGSDLDLVFLYDGDGLASTDGDKPVTVAEFFARIGKRIIHLLTTNTPAGVLYETDLRLRPSGSSGLLVSSLESFATYQMREAWTWEQQALVKARFVAGDPAVGEKFAAIRRQSLCRERDTATLCHEVRDMREKMREALGAREAGAFDLKQDTGGIVDIEFLVQ